MNDSSSQSEELYRSLFDWSGLGIARIDRRRRVIEANAELLRLVERPENVVHGTDFVYLVHPGARERLETGLAKLASGELERTTERLATVRKDGSAVPSTITAIAVRGEDRVAPTILVVIRPSAGDGGRQVILDENLVLTGLHARILEGVAAGESALQLANQLYMSRQGVDYHILAMMRKLRVPNRTALVSRAYALGMLSVATWPPQVTPAFVR